MKKVLSIDLNSSHAQVGVINQYGEIEDKIIIENDFNNLIKNLALKTKKWLEQKGHDYNSGIERIGLAVPGFVDHYHGVVKLANVLNWKEFNLKQAVGQEFKNKKIYILNNANARALGEFWIGSAASYNSEVFYSLGTRVGGAIVINGKLILGEHGFAGEFGHGGLTQESEKCECGLKNCLESSVSTRSITKKLIRILKENPNHPVAKYFNLENNYNLDFESITKIYQQHKKPLVITNLFKEILKPFISHISVMISAIDPKTIIIGGNILTLGNNLLQIIQEELEPLVPDFEKKSLILKTSSLGINAGIIGAAYFAINNSYE